VPCFATSRPPAGVYACNLTHAMRALPSVLCAAACLAVAPPAAAFCGFYVSGADAKLFNNATQVVLMREGTRTVLSMQNAYQGPPEDFAMVVPVPVVLQKENVKSYAIRHPWGGPITCKEPARGRWGGPPGGKPFEPPKSALKLASVARDAKLPSFMRSDIGELGIKGEGAPVSPTLPLAIPSAVPTDAPSAVPSASAGGDGSKKSGCFGCAVVPEAPSTGAVLASALAGVALIARRCRRSLTDND